MQYSSGIKHADGECFPLLIEFVYFVNINAQKIVFYIF
jgi:hypothetical protein